VIAVGPRGRDEAGKIICCLCGFAVAVASPPNYSLGNVCYMTIHEPQHHGEFRAT
jgi:hypothetical protein